MKNSWFTVKRINKYIWGLGEFRHSEEVISYLILGNKKALLFDTGLGIKNIKVEISKITYLPITVINSHNHFDHVGGNNLFEHILNTKKLKEIIIDPFIFKILKTPGHSPDSVCLYEIQKRWLFSGDTLYPAPIYIHLKKSNVNDYKKSIIKLSQLKISKIFPSHDDFSFPVKNINIILNSLSKNQNLPAKIYIDKRTTLLLK